MHRARIAASITLAVVLVFGAARAEESTWPSEQEAELRRVEAELLDCQRQRFAALFSKDDSAVKQLSERFTELQKQRRELLDVMGKL